MYLKIHSSIKFLLLGEYIVLNFLSTSLVHVRRKVDIVEDGKVRVRLQFIFVDRLLLKFCLIEGHNYLIFVD